MILRPLLVLWVCAFAVVLVLQQPRVAPACGPQCGVERWAVKTLSDRDTARVETVPTRTTVGWLRAQRAPAQLPATRRVGPVERTTYMVWVVVRGWKLEADSDYHLVVTDRGAAARATMIVEVPSPHCAVVCSNPHAAEWARARAAIVRALGNPSHQYRVLRPPRPATITGVGFFDVLHGQAGVAPNGIELHPVLTITFP